MGMDPSMIDSDPDLAAALAESLAEQDRSRLREEEELE